jgi:hypothetical protein
MAVSLSEAQSQIDTAEQNLATQRSNISTADLLAQKNLQSLNQAESKLPNNTSQLALRQTYPGLMGRLKRNAIDAIKNVYQKQMSGLNSYRNQLSDYESQLNQYEQNTLNPFKAQVAAVAKQQADYNTALKIFYQVQNGNSSAIFALANNPAAQRYYSDLMSYNNALASGGSVSGSLTQPSGSTPAAPSTNIGGSLSNFTGSTPFNSAAIQGAFNYNPSNLTIPIQGSTNLNALAPIQSYNAGVGSLSQKLSSALNSVKAFENLGSGVLSGVAASPLVQGQAQNIANTGINTANAAGASLNLAGSVSNIALSSPLSPVAPAYNFFSSSFNSPQASVSITKVPATTIAGGLQNAQVLSGGIGGVPVSSVTSPSIPLSLSGLPQSTISSSLAAAPIGLNTVAPSNNFLGSLNNIGNLNTAYQNAQQVAGVLGTTVPSALNSFSNSGIGQALNTANNYAMGQIGNILLPGYNAAINNPIIQSALAPANNAVNNLNQMQSTIQNLNSQISTAEQGNIDSNGYWTGSQAGLNNVNNLITQMNGLQATYDAGNNFHFGFGGNWGYNAPLNSWYQPGSPVISGINYLGGVGGAIGQGILTSLSPGITQPNRKINNNWKNMGTTDYTLPEYNLSLNRVIDMGNSAQIPKGSQTSLPTFDIGKVYPSVSSSEQAAQLNQLKLTGRTLGAYATQAGLYTIPYVGPALFAGTLNEQLKGVNYNPVQFVEQNPVEAALLVGGAALGGLALVKDAKVSNAVQKAIDEVSGEKLKSVQVAVDNEGRIYAAGYREVNGVRQLVRYEGDLAKTESGFKFVPNGEGSIVTNGVVEPGNILGIGMKPRAFGSVQTFEIGNKGVNFLKGDLRDVLTNPYSASLLGPTSGDIPLSIKLTGEPIPVYEPTSVSTVLPLTSKYGTQVVSRGTKLGDLDNFFFGSMKKSSLDLSPIEKSLVTPVGEKNIFGLAPRVNNLVQVSKNIGLQLTPEDTSVILRIPSSNPDILSFRGRGNPSSSEFLKELYSGEGDIGAIVTPKIGKAANVISKAVSSAIKESSPQTISGLPIGGSIHAGTGAYEKTPSSFLNNLFTAPMNGKVTVTRTKAPSLTIAPKADTFGPQVSSLNYSQALALEPRYQLRELAKENYGLVPRYSTDVLVKSNLAQRQYQTLNPLQHQGQLQYLQKSQSSSYSHSSRPETNPKLALTPKIFLNQSSKSKGRKNLLFGIPKARSVSLYTKVRRKEVLVASNLTPREAINLGIETTLFGNRKAGALSASIILKPSSRAPRKINVPNLLPKYGNVFRLGKTKVKGANLVLVQRNRSRLVSGKERTLIVNSRRSRKEPFSLL